METNDKKRNDDLGEKGQKLIVEIPNSHLKFDQDGLFESLLAMFRDIDEKKVPLFNIESNQELQIISEGYSLLILNSESEEALDDIAKDLEIIIGRFEPGKLFADFFGDLDRLIEKKKKDINNPGISEDAMDIACDYILETTKDWVLDNIRKINVIPLKEFLSKSSRGNKELENVVSWYDIPRDRV